MIFFFSVFVFIFFNFIQASYNFDRNSNDLESNVITNNVVTKIPSFTEKITNQTVVLGRDATFQCNVQDIGDYKVAWIYKDKRELLAAFNQIVKDRKGRIKISSHAPSSFFLHIKDVRKEDQGEYMCQINSPHYLSQSAFLNLVVPPSFIEEKTSSNAEIKEGDSVELKCAAQGYPEPEISWRREDNQDIEAQSNTGISKKVKLVHGQYLNISRATKSDMGAYICIAKNKIAAAISKRIFLGVCFPPVLKSPQPLVLASLGSDITIKCLIEAYPEPLTYWNVTKFIIPPKNNSKYEIQYIRNVTASYKGEIRLTIRNLEQSDFTTYVCAAENALGNTMAKITLDMIPTPEPPKTTTTPYSILETTNQSIKKKPNKINKININNIPNNLNYEKKPKKKPSYKYEQVPKPGLNNKNLPNDLNPWPISQKSFSSINFISKIILSFVVILILVEKKLNFI